MSNVRNVMGAWTLDGKYFTSPEVYEQETQNIFRRNGFVSDEHLKFLRAATF